MRSKASKLPILGLITLLLFTTALMPNSCGNGMHELFVNKVVICCRHSIFSMLCLVIAC